MKFGEKFIGLEFFLSTIYVQFLDYLWTITLIVSRFARFPCILLSLLFGFCPYSLPKYLQEKCFFFSNKSISFCMWINLYSIRLFLFLRWMFSVNTREKILLHENVGVFSANVGRLASWVREWLHITSVSFLYYFKYLEISLSERNVSLLNY